MAILSTGDEVVDAAQTPGPGQIRNGNGPMLAAQVAQAGGVPHFLGIARDQVEHLRPLAEEGLKADALVLSGGVSAGKLDLVPGVLEELGVQPHFHKVAMKPGKPMYFGTRPRPNSPADTLVFGLPGNPVSSLVCFELFVKPALRPCVATPSRGPGCCGRRWPRTSPTAVIGRRTTPLCCKAGRKIGGWGRCRGSARPTCAA